MSRFAFGALSDEGIQTIYPRVAYNIHFPSLVVHSRFGFVSYIMPWGNHNLSRNCWLPGFLVFVSRSYFFVGCLRDYHQVKPFLPCQGYVEIKLKPFHRDASILLFKIKFLCNLIAPYGKQLRWYFQNSNNITLKIVCMLSRWREPALMQVPKLLNVESQFLFANSNSFCCFLFFVCLLVYLSFCLVWVLKFPGFVPLTEMF